jgi:hypothetical protein
MTQPTEGEILKMWETEDGSISLSWEAVKTRGSRKRRKQQTYGNLLL